jgi:hypothetical protein
MKLTMRHVSIFFTFLLLASLSTLLAAEPSLNVIFDTDMSSDCEDVGALFILHGAVERGEVKLLGKPQRICHGGQQRHRREREARLSRRPLGRKDRSETFSVLRRD